MTHTIPEYRTASAPDIERRYPILARHYGFAEKMAASELGRAYVHPADRDFKDRPPGPPSASAVAGMERRAMLAKLLTEWAA